jgi:hypothetical protein
MEEELSLPLAAQHAGISSDRMRRKLLTGEILGRQQAGRWLVDGRSLTEYLSRQAPQLEPQPAHAT